MEQLILADNRSLLWLSSGLYCIAFAYATISISTKKRHNALVFYFIMTAGFACHSFGLYNRGIEEHCFPLNNPMEVLQVITWSAVMLEFILRPAFKLYLLGFFTSALATVIGFLSLSISSWDHVINIPLTPSNPWTGFHAALAVFSYGVFGLLAVTSLMHLLQHYALQKKRAGGLFSKLPSIIQLDEINKRLLLMGVSILTISIALGFANWAHDPQSVGTKKLIAALVVWLMYIMAHKFRVQKKLIAAHFSWSCLILFLVALISLWPLHRNAPKQNKDSSQIPSLIQE